MSEEPVANQEEESSQAVEAPEPSFQEAIAGLVRLQAKDNEIDAIRRKLEAVPAALEEKNKRLEEAKKEVEAVKETINRLILERKTFEGEAAKKEEELKKRGGELQTLKSNDAYKALMTEIDKLKAEKDKLEDQILENMDRADEAKRNEGKIRQEAEAKKKVVEQEIAAVNNEKKALEDAAAKLEQERSGLGPAVPPSILKRYDTMRARKGGEALAPLLEGGSCGGCHMNFPTHIINDLLKAKDFVTCEKCQRILYIPKK